MSLAKTIARCLGSLRAVPLRVGYVVGRRLLGPEKALMASSEKAARIAGHLGVYTRQAFYRRALASVGQDVHFGYMSLLSKADARIGDRVYIGRFCSLGLVDLGDDVMLADGVQIPSGARQHGTAAPVPRDTRGADPAAAGQTLRDNLQVFEKVTIGRGAWLGAGAIVMADVGEHAIVAAGSVVVKPVASGTKVGGVPARELGGEKESRVL